MQEQTQLAAAHLRAELPAARLHLAHGRRHVPALRGTATCCQVPSSYATEQVPE